MGRSRRFLLELDSMEWYSIFNKKNGFACWLILQTKGEIIWVFTILYLHVTFLVVH